jgi:hypothetical protein
MQSATISVLATGEAVRLLENDENAYRVFVSSKKLQHMNVGLIYNRKAKIVHAVIYKTDCFYMFIDLGEHQIDKTDELKMRPVVDLFVSKLGYPDENTWVIVEKKKVTFSSRYTVGVETKSDISLNDIVSAFDMVYGSFGRNITHKVTLMSNENGRVVIIANSSHWEISHKELDSVIFSAIAEFVAYLL